MNTTIAGGSSLSGILNNLQQQTNKNPASTTITIVIIIF